MRNQRGAAGGVLAVVVMVLLAVTPLAAQTEAPDLSGTWIGKTEVPDQGTDEATLVLMKAEGSYKATITDSLGMLASDGIVTDLKFADNKLTFNFALADGTVMTMRLSFAEDKLSGQWEHPEGMAAAVVFERRKQ